MGLQDDIDLLSHVGLFRDFGLEHLRLIAFGTERQVLKKGTRLFAEGDESEGGYVIVSGQVDIVLHRGDRDLVLESCSQAGLIGELALITGNRRVADAIAKTDCEILFIPRSLFHRLLSEYPDKAQMLHMRISQSVRELVQQMQDIQEKLKQIPPFGGTAK